MRCGVCGNPYFNGARCTLCGNMEDDYLGHADVKTTYRYLHHNRRIKERPWTKPPFPPRSRD